MSLSANCSTIGSKAPARLPQSVLLRIWRTFKASWKKRNGLTSYAHLKLRMGSSPDQMERLLASESSARHFSFGCRSWAFAVPAQRSLIGEPERNENYSSQRRQW